MPGTASARFGVMLDELDVAHPRPAVVPPAGRRDSRRPPLFVAGSPIWFAWLECRITDFTRRIAQESLDGRIEEIANAVSGA